jgi:phosphoenolpyruvate---glycerone phosphotransferase subunit DhaM
MTRNVGIVIVSHSPDVARGAAAMVREMVGEEVPLAFCGGDPGGGLGTSVGEISAAIERAWSERGVAILVDLGGAAMNSEMAVELLPDERRRLVVVCDAPLVEGAVMAATEAGGGRSLDDVRRTAEGVYPHASAGAQGDRGALLRAAASIRLSHPGGLHARPAIKLTKLAGRFRSECRLAAAPGGPWVDAKSVARVMAMKAPSGVTLHLEAEGEDASEAVAALIRLVENDFGDPGA